MARMARFALAVLVVVVAGCGGPTTYRFADIRDCVLERDDLVMKKAEDFIAEDASGGAANIEVGGNVATIALGRTVGDAKRIVATYELLAQGFDQPVDDILFRDANLVIIWEDTPTNEEREAVADCYG